MSSEVYFEPQEKQTSLCGQHAINNLLQGPYFTAMDLGHIGSRLDQQETNLYHITRHRNYSNVSMDGYFSVEVLITALKQLDLFALPLSHPICSDANEHPDREQGFILYFKSHWIAYRKINNIWYNLNSLSNYLLMQPQPVRITDFFLSAQISKLEDKGFRVFVVRGVFPSLGRNAPRSAHLKETYCWYHAVDIKSHVELDKQSRSKRQQRSSHKHELMMDDTISCVGLNNISITTIVSGVGDSIKNAFHKITGTNDQEHKDEAFEKAQKESLKTAQSQKQRNLQIKNENDDVNLAMALSASIAKLSALQKPQSQLPIESSIQCEVTDDGNCWSCSACSFKNANALPKCEMCNAQRGVAVGSNQHMEAQTDSNPNAIVHNSQTNEYNYKMGDEVLYPKNCGTLHDDFIPNIEHTPNQYDLGQIIGINRENDMVSIISDKEENINIHSALISKFQMNKYSEYKRGTTVCFYDVSQHCWNEGRIETIMHNRSVAINYGNDKFEIVPIYYLKPYEHQFN